MMVVVGNVAILSKLPNENFELHVQKRGRWMVATISDVA